MSKKIISVVGATGTQGGSVVDALLETGSYKIRGITRNPSSDTARALAAKGVDVVQADCNEISSLIAAFEGSSFIFAVGDFFEPFLKSDSAEYAVEVESRHGINLAKAASATSTLEHYIWSTLPNSRKISGGKIVVPHFESKNLVDDYIRSDAALLAKTTFFVAGYYAENFNSPTLVPISVPGTEQYLQLYSVAKDVPFLGLGHARTNVGLFIRAILAQPERTLPAKTVLAYTEETSAGKMFDSWSKVKGKDAHYIHVERDVYKALFSSLGEELAIMMDYFDEAQQHAWYVGEDALTKDDLGVTGLVGIEEAFART